jgi:2-polyprenyl-6-methoxyphenol hydroxylase-like FAD-dependent oxidoreductase
LRELINASECAELRTECRVFSRKEFGNTVEVSYRDRDGATRTVECKFLVGADGKRGIIRKEFLEPLGIQQEVGV